MADKRAEVPEKYSGFVEKARTGSRSSAIRLHCLECLGYKSADVRRCTAPDCWLYPYRTGKFKSVKGKRVKMVAGVEEPEDIEEIEDEMDEDEMDEDEREDKETEQTEESTKPKKKLKFKKKA